jgi:hypothetical protein
MGMTVPTRTPLKGATPLLTRLQGCRPNRISVQTDTVFTGYDGEKVALFIPVFLLDIFS